MIRRIRILNPFSGRTHPMLAFLTPGWLRAQLGANGIQARVSSYPALFVREDGLVKLREAAPSANGESA
jgi:hypothetical protein